MKEAYRRVDESKLDREFIASDEFVDLFVSTTERVVRAHESEKIAALRNAFVNATTVRGSKGPLKDIVLRTAGDLTGAHMRVLRQAVAEGHSQEERSVSLDERYINADRLRQLMPDLSETEILAITADLLGLGIFRNWWIGHYGGFEGETDRFALTEFGLAFVAYITEPH